MSAIVCKTCGGSAERVGNYYICEYCGNKWEIDSANDVYVVDRANAWSALRDGDFEKASEPSFTVNLPCAEAGQPAAVRAILST